MSASVFASYLPRWLVARMMAQAAPLTEPVVDQVPGALLFADISGFTALSEQLAEAGPHGAETLSRLLNDYFGQLIDTIVAEGGDVVKFAGDALLALWPMREAGTLAAATHAAAHCALTIQDRLRDYQAGGRPLSLRIALSAGEISIPQLGGTYGRWEFLLAGEPVAQVNLAEKVTPPGQVVLAPTAWALLPSAVGERVAEHGYQLTRLPALGPPHHAPVAPPLVPAVPPFETTLPLEAALRAYVPAAIRERLSAGQTDWLAELRRVTVLFVNFPGFNHTLELDRAQAAMLMLQRTVYQFEGSINKLNVDDKGVTLVAAFGLPPLTHADDPLRGAQAALTIRNKMREQGYEVSVGVTTGRVFCGAIGNAQRREYTFIGNVVNLAARLMQASTGEVLCDATTYQAASENLKFAVLAPITVKGRLEPVPIYRPLAVQNRAKMQQMPLVGRAAERAWLAEAGRQLREAGQSGLLLVEGEAGIGKSRLVSEAVEQAAAQGLVCLVGAGDAIEKSTPYHAWREVFTQIFDLHLFDNPDQRRRHVRLALGPERLRLAPLLNDLLALEIPQSPLTEQMTGQVRADNLRELLVQVLQVSVKRSPKVLIIEDAHWLDSASWALTQAVAQRVQPLLLIIATRPLTEPFPAEYTALVNQPGLHRLRLEPLPLADAITLVCQRLKVQALPPPVVTLIKEKAEGHPFFSEELAYSLRDAGLLRIQDGVCELAPGVDLNQVAFPDTVQGIIISRIDRLGPQQQLALKTASVIGRMFAFQLLRDIYPIEDDKPALQDYLHALERLDLTPLDTPEPDLTYIFKHIITREVAYNLMLVAQRQQLHQAVAEWHERRYQADLSPYYGLLAYHWRLAGGAAQALAYLEKAGEQAHHNGAYQEALNFFNEAVRVADKQVVGAERLGHWEMRLGLSHIGLGQLGEGGAHLRRALELLGAPMPPNLPLVVGGLLTEAVRQVNIRRAPSTSSGGVTAAHPELVEGEGRAAQSHRAAVTLDALEAYERLGETYFFNGQTLPTIYCTLRTLNLAEPLGPSAGLGRAYANLTIAAGLIPHHAWAEMYMRLARTVAQQIQASEGGAETSPTLGIVLARTSVYLMGVGQWDAVLTSLNEARAIFQRLGNWRWLSETMAIRESALYFTAQAAASALQSEETRALAARIGNTQHLAWALNQKAAQAVRAGDYELATALITRESLPLTLSGKDGTEELISRSLLARAHWQSRAVPLAQQEAATALRLAKAGAVTSFSLNRAYEHLGAVFFAMWEADPHDRPARAGAWAMVALYDRYARIFPIGLPRAALYRGWAQWLEHRPTQAAHHWQAALAHAEKLHLPYEQGLALQGLARLAGAEQATYAQRARALLVPLGVVEGRE